MGWQQQYQGAGGPIGGQFHQGRPMGEQQYQGGLIGGQQHQGGPMGGQPPPQAGLNAGKTLPPFTFQLSAQLEPDCP